jgi:hypothetical protein
MQPIDSNEVLQWSKGLGISMTLFIGWQGFVDQCLFWAPAAKPEAAMLAVETIRMRLMDVEASLEAVAIWSDLAR